MTNKAAKDKQPTKEANQPESIGTIDPEVEGMVVGSHDFIEWKPEKEGERLVGYYVGFEFVEKPYESNSYEVHNAGGIYKFWGKRVLADLMEKVPEKVILDVTYDGERQPKGSGNAYSVFTVKYYSTPSSFDPTRHCVYLDPQDNMLHIATRESLAQCDSIPF